MAAAPLTATSSAGGWKRRSTITGPTAARLIEVPVDDYETGTVQFLYEHLVEAQPWSPGRSAPASSRHRGDARTDRRARHHRSHDERSGRARRLGKATIYRRWRVQGRAAHRRGRRARSARSPCPTPARPAPTCSRSCASAVEVYSGSRRGRRDAEPRRRHEPRTRARPRRPRGLPGRPARRPPRTCSSAASNAATCAPTSTSSSPSTCSAARSSTGCSITGGPIDERLADGVAELILRGFAPAPPNPKRRAHDEDPRDPDRHRRPHDALA